ncbi:CD209 antigen-like protein B isoform X2 [Thalassophryne amazonica]|uniref:CD209 antigen-like protein B isoform X2 n=1 Tax=Thalassophryne amazonica TaxID=390379 RepID=UPI0014721661|nr:CD209 antigen-like protein B isoform X2 [Thalassophryne amazonica]
MSEELYTTIDFTKVVRFQAGEKENDCMDGSNTTDGVQIYDNYMVPKLEDSSTEDQEAASVTPESRKKNRVIVAGVLLGVLCLLLLTAIIVLVIQFSEDRRNWNIERSQFEMNYNLTKERDDLQTNNKKLERLNYNLSNERDNLQTNNTKLERLSFNLTQNMSQLKVEKDNLTAINRNLSQEKKELQAQLSKTLADVCAYGNSFGGSCYLFSVIQKNWYDSKAECEKRAAHLVTISSEDEQQFITGKVTEVHWIGLTDEEKEGTWKWVNGEPLNTKYWAWGEPNNGGNNEDCVVVSSSTSLENWNDLNCQQFLHRWICEKEINQ